MNPTSDYHTKEYGRLDNSSIAGNGDFSQQMIKNNGEAAGNRNRKLASSHFPLYFHLSNRILQNIHFKFITGKQRTILVEWLNSKLPSLKLPTNASDEDLRSRLTGGSNLCQLLNRVRPGSVKEVVELKYYPFLFPIFFSNELHCKLLVGC